MLTAATAAVDGVVLIVLGADGIVLGADGIVLGDVAVLCF